MGVGEEGKEKKLIKGRGTKSNKVDKDMTEMVFFIIMGLVPPLTTSVTNHKNHARQTITKEKLAKKVCYLLNKKVYVIPNIKDMWH